MDVDTDDSAAPSSLERLLTDLESRVLDCDLGILGRALLINNCTSSIEEVNEAIVAGVLALSPMGLADLATQRSSEPEPDWEHVGTLEGELRRSWLLFDTHVALCYLDLFHERGPTRPPEIMGRLNIFELEHVMWPAGTRASLTPVSTDTGLLEGMPDGLSQQSFPCEEPPYRKRFVDVGVSAALMQVATAVQPGLRFGCAVILSLVIVGFLLAPFFFAFLATRGVSVATSWEFTLLWLYFQYFVTSRALRWLFKYWYPLPDQP